MDLKDYSVKDLLLTAIKSEEDTYQLYDTLNSRLEGDRLSAKLNFLTEQELKHRKLLERFHSERFPGEEVDVNDITTDVPLPMIDIAPGYYPVGDLLGQVMESELITSEFYGSWKEINEKDDELDELLDYLSEWERKHYRIISELKKDLGEYGKEKVEW